MPHFELQVAEQPGMACKAAPYLVQKTFGHTVDAQVLRAHPLLVPAPQD